VLAADAHFQVWAGAAAQLYADAHQLAHTLFVDAGEGILRQDALLQVVDEEAQLCVVTADAKGGLGQIVRAVGVTAQA